jgi:hypothetical protein
MLLASLVKEMLKRESPISAQVLGAKCVAEMHHPLRKPHEFAFGPAYFAFGQDLHVGCD